MDVYKLSSQDVTIRNAIELQIQQRINHGYCTQPITHRPMKYRFKSDSKHIDVNTLVTKLWGQYLSHKTLRSTINPQQTNRDWDRSHISFYFTTDFFSFPLASSWITLPHWCIKSKLFHPKNWSRIELLDSKTASQNIYSKYKVPIKQFTVHFKWPQKNQLTSSIYHTQETPPIVGFLLNRAAAVLNFR